MARCNQRIVLASRPDGKPTEANFRLEEVDPAAARSHPREAPASDSVIGWSHLKDCFSQNPCNSGPNSHHASHRNPSHAEHSRNPERA